ncbi:GNAT family N-acetyltransferase [Micromonospora chaiyaphumensis]|uniref:Mycothiol synthase n=1 Tax=Micromonospora chaiyaphumensis TaxID=307119 RepID=A0A1C4XR62_9ACTN|nr:GNAT family N-acetyltransferase [Micromonospora chaiyaphumensis]SCF11000.1 mycothiol synthase [Micromonospora chaiyaphumensis]
MYEKSSSLTWRPLTSEDARAGADLLNAMETVDKIGEKYDEEDTLQELIDPYAELERGSLAAFDGDVMVGYMKTNYKPGAEEVHRIFMDGGVHPDYRRQGIGTVLLKAGVAAAKELHALHHPTLKLVIDARRGEHIAGVAELFRSQGFAPARYYQHLEHPLGHAIPETAIPAGMRIEPWSKKNDEAFRMIRNEAFEDHWGMAPLPANSWASKITNHTFKPEVSFLLRDMTSGAPAGMLVTKYWEADTAATGVRNAHFMFIGTLRDYRKRGVASALIGHALRAAADQDYGRASVHVDSANPTGAFRIYEKAGFTSKRRFVCWALEV